jgi:hypothetical protein
MKDKKGNLYLYEAIELRNEYDSHVELLEKLLGVEPSKKRGFYDEDDDKDKVLAAGFDPKEIEGMLKKLQTKRVKLNQEIQKKNFETLIEYEGTGISIAEALEIRKNLIGDIKAISERVKKSSYKRVIHKEGRDIVEEPRHNFTEIYKEYQDKIRHFRSLANQIHAANHLATVKYKDE